MRGGWCCLGPESSDTNKIGMKSRFGQMKPQRQFAPHIIVNFL
jgi:hypothetical protein